MDADAMVPAMIIDRRNGCIRLGEEVSLKPYQMRETIEPVVAAWLTGVRDHQNGYVWLNLRGLRFGGEEAGLSLCFHNGRFERAAWSVHLPGAPMEGGWPTRAAIDAEIAFVRKELAAMFGSTKEADQVRFLWGEVSSLFDEKGFLASNEIRYRRLFGG
jgi:hypothetical protein